MKLSLCSSLALTCLLTCGTAQQQAPAPPAPKQSDGWRLYTAPDKSFSVEVPCQMEQRNVSATSKPIYEYDCLNESAPSLSFFGVGVLDISEVERERLRDEAAFERSIRESFTPNHRIVRMSPFKIEGGLGREIVMTNTNDTDDNSRGLVIIFGRRRYDVSYVAPDRKELESPAAERFFASFKPLQ